MRYFICYILVFFLIAFSGCFFNASLPKYPCQNDEFLKDISRFKKSELQKLARVLESSTYGSYQDNGCRHALLARVYLALERMSEASDYFSMAAKKLPEIKDYFLLAKAHVELKRQNFDDAYKIANALLSSRAASFSPQFTLRIRQVLADIAVLKKDDQQIIQTHQNLLAKGYAENEVLLFNLATALTNIGEYERANEIYRKLLVNFPLSPGGKRATELRNLAHYNLALNEVEKRFNKLIENLAYDQVAHDCDLLLKHKGLDKETKGQIRSFRAQSLLQNNQFSKGLNSTKRTTNKELESYAFALAKVGRPLEASEHYEKLYNQVQDKEGKAKACFFKGFSLYEASLYSMALFAWQGCHQAVKDSRVHYENYLWYQALASLLSEQYDKSLAFLNNLKKAYPKSQDILKYDYFIGYSLSQLHQKSEADKVLNQLVQKKTPHYYTLLARNTLNLPDLRGAKILPDALMQFYKESKNIDCKNALLLYSLGFKEDAKDLILRSTATQQEKLALLQRLGFYHDVYKKSHLLKPQALVMDDSLKANPTLRASFPLPFAKDIEETSKKFGVRFSELYAIMRTESAFLEDAVSNRGAMGLMQMMPFVAHDLAAKLSIKEFSTDHLKDPKTSIELGAYFLAILGRQFGNFHLVAAAYNAGSYQVQKWLDQFGHLPFELFVERIPFKQTRDYIKKVLLSESLYHALNGQALRLSL